MDDSTPLGRIAGPELDRVSVLTDAPARTQDPAAPIDRRVVLLDRGQVALDGALLRRLRQDRLLSQQDLADECWRRNIRVSIATIKRVEAGRAVRFRIAHELARCFDVPVMQIVRPAPALFAEAGTA
ncbi:helix-turn-helix domain-containing protein [Lysobacter capsici]|uniref:helix-turn-helix domain-containing protein n=1 Tax=Lysobacter capsici TaxID=435897 RepID=UPI001BFFE581|nr:helix-turn-helix domain-containing protein [Lysobacter capsici]QWF17030.1 helix-turn-helix domain-containing protein [Lysobacter capsici]